MRPLIFLISSREWLYGHSELVALVLYTFLRTMADHACERLHWLRDIEVQVRFKLVAWQQFRRYVTV